LYTDARLRLEAAKLKYEFMNNAQALIHGDLHSGSIFVKEDSTKVIDPEFAFYGPIGYDVGNVVGNLCFAWANARVTMPNGAERDAYISWVEDAITQVVELFKEKFSKRFPEVVTDRMAATTGYIEWFLAGVLADAAGVAGLEMIRRTVGTAQVKDLTSIENEKARTIAERIVILAAKDFILHRPEYKKGRDYVRTLQSVFERLCS